MNIFNVFWTGRSKDQGETLPGHWERETGSDFRITRGRSELRAAEEETFRLQWLGFRSFMEENIRMGGGSENAMRRLTVQVMNGIAPLLANAFNAIEAVVNAVLSPEQTAKALKLIEEKRFAAARILLGVKTVQAGDAFILGPEFALDHGFLAAARSVLGDAPVAVIVRDAKDRAFIEQFNASLALDRRIIPALGTDLTAARSALRKQVKTESMALKALLYGAETLKDQLSDITVQRITPRMFQNFLSLAGEQISSLVAEVQAQFATERSA